MGTGRLTMRVRPYGAAVLRVPFTKTCDHTFGNMSGMRKMIILAMVAIGTVRIVWRVLSPVEQHRYAMEWTAGE